MWLLANAAEQAQVPGALSLSEQVDSASQVFPGELHHHSADPMSYVEGLWIDKQDTAFDPEGRIDYEQSSQSDQLRWFICYIMVY